MMSNRIVEISNPKSQKQIMSKLISMFQKYHVRNFTFKKMLLGHYGPAGIIHLLFSDISFVWLMISTQVIDIAYFVLSYSCKLVCNLNVDYCPYPIVCSEYSTFNVELMRSRKPFPFNSHATFSHSLTGAITLTIPFTILYALIHGRGKRSLLSLYVILLLGVASHWALDVLVHRPDMSILPPLIALKIGYGTWQNWTLWENYWLEMSSVIIGFIALTVAHFRFGGPRFRFWIVALVYLALSGAITYIVYFGDDLAKKADSVIDGSVSPPDQTPVIFTIYTIITIISIFLQVDTQKKKESIKSQ